MSVQIDSVLFRNPIKKKHQIVLDDQILRVLYYLKQFKIINGKTKVF